MSKKFALVKWIGGDDKDTYSVGIDINHIKEFDYEEFKNGNADPKELYVVEWHDTKKEPPGGWLCYNARVIDILIIILASIPYLEKKLDALNGLVSPRRVKFADNHGGNELTETSSIDDENELNESGKEDSDSSFDEPEIKKKKLEDTYNNSITNLENQFIVQVNENIKEVNDVGATSMAGSSHQQPLALSDHQHNRANEKTSVTVSSPSKKYITQDDFNKAFNKIYDLLEKQSSKQDELQKKPTLKSVPRGRRTESNPSKIEIGETGSNVFIDYDKWVDADRQSTFTAFTVSLLLAAFPLNVLEESNYKGGASKVNRRKDQPRHKALDPKIIDAIRTTVKRKYPNTFNAGKFGSTINTKLGRIRILYEAQMKDEKSKETSDAENKN